MNPTACVCTVPGWCIRHQCYKSRALFAGCRDRPETFAAWERGELRVLCHDPPLRTAPCRRLGVSRRQVACPSCRGHVSIKVYACDRFGECTLGRPIEGLASCAICAEYTSDAVELKAIDR